MMHAMSRYSPSPIKKFSNEEVYAFVQEQALFIDQVNREITWK